MKRYKVVGVGPFDEGTSTRWYIVAAFRAFLYNLVPNTSGYIVIEEDES